MFLWNQKEAAKIFVDISKDIMKHSTESNDYNGSLVRCSDKTWIVHTCICIHELCMFYLNIAKCVFSTFFKKNLAAYTANFFLKKNMEDSII